MKRVFIFLCAIVLVLGMTALASANSIESSTMRFEWFIGDLELVADGTRDDGDGWYGTIGAIGGTYYAPWGGGAYQDPATGLWYTPDGNPAKGGFDVYAKDGGTAYVDGMKDENGNPNETWTIGPDHDAYSSGGPWGTWYDPDVPDYQNYKLVLTGTSWALRGFDYSDAYSGTIVWDSGYLSGYAYEDGQNWNPTWSWGEEDIPLQFPGFEVTVIEPHSPGQVILTPSSSPVPEPATMLLLGAGLVGLAGFGRKKFFKK